MTSSHIFNLKTQTVHYAIMDQFQIYKEYIKIIQTTNFHNFPQIPLYFNIYEYLRALRVLKYLELCWWSQSLKQRSFSTLMPQKTLWQSLEIELENFNFFTKNCHFAICRSYLHINTYLWFWEFSTFFFLYRK